MKLIIAGGHTPGQSDGKEFDRINRIVNELKLNDITEFPGQLGLDNLHYYYAAADVCVVPSHYEPFGLVAIEAMASGTPVVASDVGGLQFTVVNDVTGLLVRTKHVEGFTKAIDKILSSDSLCRDYGRAAKKRIRSLFRWDGVAQQLSEMYAKVTRSCAGN